MQCHFEPFWWFWAILGHFGAVLGHFGAPWIPEWPQGPGPINQVPRLPWEGDQRNLGGPKPLSLWSKGVLLYLLVPPKSLFCPSNSIICRPPKIIVLSPQIPFLVAPKIILTPQIPYLVPILGFGGTEAVFIIMSKLQYIWHDIIIIQYFRWLKWLCDIALSWESNAAMRLCSYKHSIAAQSLSL